MKPLSHNRQTGLTLLELLLVLVVITLLALLGIRGYTTVRTNTKIAETVKRIDKIVDASYIWVKGQNGNFCGPGNASPPNCPEDKSISTEKLIALKLITSKDLINPWGTGKSSSNTIQITPLRNAIAIRLDHLPSAVCFSLLEKLKERAKSAYCMAPGFSTFEVVF